MSTVSHYVWPTEHSLDKIYEAESQQVPMDNLCFDTFYHKHANAVFAFLQRYLANFNDAEDCFQSTWLSVSTHFDDVANHPKPLAWLYRTARNKATDHLRRRQNQLELTVEHDRIQDLNTAEINPESAISARELADDLEHSIQQMSPKVRIAYHLRIECDLSFKDVAALLDEPVERIAGRVRLALKQLQKIVNQHRELP